MGRILVQSLVLDGLGWVLCVVGEPMCGDYWWQGGARCWLSVACNVRRGFGKSCIGDGGIKG